MAVGQLRIAQVENVRPPRMEGHPVLARLRRCRQPRQLNSTGAKRATSKKTVVVEGASHVVMISNPAIVANPIEMPLEPVGLRSNSRRGRRHHVVALTYAGLVLSPHELNQICA
jgi:hypothetical protein